MAQTTPTTKPNPRAAKVLELRAILNEKSEARKRATAERERLAAEVPRVRATLAGSSDLVKKAKVTQLLTSGAKADEELAAAQQRHEAATVRIDDLEERASLLAAVEQQLYAEVPQASEELKLAEDALLSEVLKARAARSTELLRQVAHEIALENSLSGIVGMDSVLGTMRRRLDAVAGERVIDKYRELRAQLLREEGAL